MGVRRLCRMISNLTDPLDLALTEMYPSRQWGDSALRLVEVVRLVDILRSLHTEESPFPVGTSEGVDIATERREEGRL